MVKGRLTKRYRADRAVKKLRKKGSLNLRDTCYRGPQVRKSNTIFAQETGVRRIGQFGVKVWLGAR